MNSKQIRTCLTWTGVAGIAVTSWMSVWCSRKADEAESKKDKLIAYGPAIASGIFTAGCFLCAEKMANKELAALAAGCAFIANKNRKLSAPKKASTSLPAKPLSPAAPWEGPSIEWTGKGTTLCFEAYSGRFFYSSKEAVDQAISELNERYADGENPFLNDFYELLGIEKTGYGGQFQWCDLDEAHKGPILIYPYDGHGKHGESMYIIDIYTYPMEV